MLPQPDLNTHAFHSVPQQPDITEECVNNKPAPRAGVVVPTESRRAGAGVRSVYTSLTLTAYSLFFFKISLQEVMLLLFNNQLLQHYDGVMMKRCLILVIMQQRVKK